MKFADKVVIITGASSGIGEGVAKKFLAEGAKVVGCGVEPEMHIQDENATYPFTIIMLLFFCNICCDGNSERLYT